MTLADHIRSHFISAAVVVQSDIVIVALAAVHKHHRFHHPSGETFAFIQLIAQDNGSRHISGIQLSDDLFFLFRQLAYCMESVFPKFLLNGLQQSPAERICQDMLLFPQKKDRQHHIKFSGLLCAAASGMYVVVFDQRLFNTLSGVF